MNIILSPAAEFDVLQRLAQRDFEGPEIVLDTGDVVRTWPVHPLRIYYQREPDALRVIRIYHHTRRPITR